MIYRIFVLPILMGEMLLTNTPLTLAELEGTRSEISIPYCHHYLHYIPRGDNITHVLSLKFLIIEHKRQSL